MLWGELIAQHSKLEIHLLNSLPEHADVNCPFIFPYAYVFVPGPDSNWSQELNSCVMQWP